MHSLSREKLSRILDANFNRTKEGLRVCEDICRFVLDDETLTRQFKNVRHQLTKILAYLGFRRLVKARAIESDVGKGSSKTELRRKEISDIFYANLQRAKESMRVLEEFSKLVNLKSAVAVKGLRYKIYALEKKVIRKL